MSGGTLAVERIDTSQFQRTWEIISGTHRSGKATITVGGPDRGPIGFIDFQNVVGPRVLDESDLLKFWPTCSGEGVDLFRVFEGGWLAQESIGPGFLSATRPGVIDIRI